MSPGILGKKIGMTQVFRPDGQVVPVTLLKAGPCVVTQRKTPNSDGYDAVQLGLMEFVKPSRINKPIGGHLKKANAEGVKFFRELRLRSGDTDLKPGDRILADQFKPRDVVDVIGISKGKGFAGVMKRHNFKGGDASHGAKGWRRRSGAIGQRLFPGTVMRGMKMPGHMGQVRRTTQNLEVIQVRPDDNLLLIKGSIPGAEGDYIVIREAKKIAKGSDRMKQIHDARKKAAAGSGDDKKKGAAKAAAKK